MKARLANLNDALAVRGFNCAHSDRDWVAAVQRGVELIADELERGDVPEWVLLMFDDRECLIGIARYSIISNTPPDSVIWVAFGAIDWRAQGAGHGKTLLRTMQEHLRTVAGGGRVTFRVDRRNGESVGLCKSMELELDAVPGGKMLHVTEFF